MQPHYFSLSGSGEERPPSLIPSPKLEQLLDVKSNYKCDALSSQNVSTAIHIHAFYIEELQIVLRALDAAHVGSDIYITTDSEDKRRQIKSVLETFGPCAIADHVVQILVTPNRGRNIEPLFLHLLDSLSDYTCVLHLHTKRSPHSSLGRAWLLDLLDCLVGDEPHFRHMYMSFAKHSDLGLVMPRPFPRSRHFYNWGLNFHPCKDILDAYYPDKPFSIACPLVFPSGMMFWFRPAAVKSLSQLYTDFADTLPAEPLSTDGTILHAIERIIAYTCEADNFRWALCSSSKNEMLHEQSSCINLSLWHPLSEIYIEYLCSTIATLQLCKKELAEIKSRRIWIRRLHD